MGEIYDKTKGRYVTEAVVEVKGSMVGQIPEYGWEHDQPEPTPEESFAFGVRIESDKSMTTMYWNGSVWGETKL